MIRWLMVLVNVSLGRNASYIPEVQCSNVVGVVDLVPCWVGFLILVCSATES